MSGWRSPFARALLVSLLLALLALAFFGFRAEAVQVETAQATRKALIESLREEGRLRVLRRFSTTAPVAGFVSRVELRPGDSVAAGQPLATISASAGALLDGASADRLAGELAAANAEVSAARARLKAARSAADLASAEWRRVKPLLTQGTVSGMEGDRIRMAAERAADERDAVEYALQLAQAQVQSTRALLDRQGERGDRLVEVTAPVPGVVLHRWRESQGPIAMGERLVDIGDPRSLEVEVDLLSADAVRVSEGMAVRLHRWGGAEPLLARVRRVEPVAATKISALGVEEQRVLVWSELVSPVEAYERLGDGYRVEAEFVLSEGEALVVPDAALFRRGADWALFVVENDAARERIVTIGRSSGVETEILAGLNAGEWIVVHPDDRVQDGSRVRTSPPG